MLTDEMLRQAAGESVEAFIETVERDYDPEHAFVPSPRFERKIRKLNRKANHPAFYRAVRRVAALFLAIFTASAIWLTVDTEARAAFLTWIREVYENNVIYEFFAPPQQTALPEYTFSAIPEGYEETLFIDDETTSVRMYENGKGDVLTLSCHALTKDVVSGVFSDDYICEAVRVGEYDADFYAPTDPTESNELIWIDEQAKVVFCISSFLEKEDMVQLGESIAKK